MAELQFSLAREYPSQAPRIAVVQTIGLSDEESNRLEQHLEAEATEQLGEPMIYALVDAAQEWLLPLNSETKRIASSAHEEVQLHSRRQEAERQEHHAKQFVAHEEKAQEAVRLQQLSLEAEEKLRDEWLRARQPQDRSPQRGRQEHLSRKQQLFLLHILRKGLGSHDQLPSLVRQLSEKELLPLASAESHTAARFPDARTGYDLLDLASNQDLYQTEFKRAFRS